MVYTHTVHVYCMVYSIKLIKIGCCFIAVYTIAAIWKQFWWFCYRHFLSISLSRSVSHRHRRKKLLACSYRWANIWLLSDWFQQMLIRIRWNNEFWKKRKRKIKKNSKEKRRQQPVIVVVVRYIRLVMVFCLYRMHTNNNNK